MSAPPLASPTSFHSGPPPPYSYSSSTASSVVGGHTNGYTSPSIDHRKSNEENEQYQSSRQSLPSIHEALNRDQPLSITSLLSQTAAPPPPTVLAQQHSPPASPSVPSWRYRDQDAERSEEIRRNEIKESLAKPSFGEAVKRHLDHFDLETSLNEIAEGSGRALDFSRLYRSQAHQTQRSGPVPGSMPSLAECDEMIGYQKRVLDSMHNIKEAPAVLLEQKQRSAAVYVVHITYEEKNELTLSRGLPLQVGVTAATEPKHRNGVEVQMVRGHCVTRAVFVSRSSHNG
ncbi:MAG: hypothetical protein Q9220_007826 [cf. Caloplaca sp. 1 TL-2023]